MHFLLRTKGSHEKNNFGTLKSFDENLPNSSCLYPNHKSVFLQILHDSSVSRNITPLYFLGQTLYALHKRDRSKCKLDFLVFGSKFTKFLSFLKQKISFSSNFAPLFGIMRHISSILFLAKTLYTFSKSSLLKYKFGEIPQKSEILKVVKSLKFCTVVGFFCKNHIKFQLQKYRRLISYDIEE